MVLAACVISPIRRAVRSWVWSFEDSAECCSGRGCLRRRPGFLRAIWVLTIKHASASCQYPLEEKYNKRN